MRIKKYRISEIVKKVWDLSNLDFEIGNFTPSLPMPYAAYISILYLHDIISVHYLLFLCKHYIVLLSGICACICIRESGAEEVK